MLVYPNGNYWSTITNSNPICTTIKSILWILPMTLFDVTLPELNYDLPCSNCGAPTILREGRNGEFWGCSTYPKCSGSYHEEEDYPDYNYGED